jgi:NADH pyrophosphatase NudC (nudix superfamily)
MQRTGITETNHRRTVTPDPHLAALAASTAGIGLLMALAGVQKSALEWRRRRRICPSCGHEVRRRACGCS